MYLALTLLAYGIFQFPLRLFVGKWKHTGIWKDNTYDKTEHFSYITDVNHPGDYTYEYCKKSHLEK